MWERFCPTIQRPCIDGLADGEQLVCAFWDSVDEKCGFVAGMVAACGSGEAVIESMSRYIVKPEQLQDVQKALNIIMNEAARIDGARAREAIKQKEAGHRETGAS
jgi:hypothetical protein